MSPHAANSLVHDLVQMAQAMEQLPQVREELESANSTIESLRNVIQRLEIRIMDYKGEADQFRATVRDLEVARDDAELRFLEADERTTQALAFVRTVFGNAGSLIQALDPPRVAEAKASEPVAQPAKVEVTTSAPFSALAPDGTVSPGEQHPDIAADAGQPATQEPVSVQADPTTVSEVGQSSEPVASGVTPDVPDTQPSPGPYSGRRYIDVPGWVSREDWLARGGTQEDYDWREGSQSIA